MLCGDQNWNKQCTFTFAWALLFQAINILVFTYKVFTPFSTGSCAEGKYNFEHINERCSRFCRRFPDLDFFCLLYLDMSLRDTLYMLL